MTQQDKDPAKPKKQPEVYHPEIERKIDTIKRNVLEKKAQEEQMMAYEKKRAEEEKENEKKKKEHRQAESKKQFTFDFGGQIMYLKPNRDDNIDMKEFTEIGVNAKKNLRANNPVEGEAKVRIAEIIEREVPEKTQQTRPQPSEDRQRKAPKVGGPIKPAPPILDIIQVAPGVTISTSKNQFKKGQPVKPDGKLRFDEFKEKHRGISPLRAENSDEARKREKEKKERREKKYRRTIDNWKEELKKGLKDNINFDADLLINLIMTEDFENDRERKVQKRAEKEKEAHDYYEFKVGPSSQPEKARLFRQASRGVPQQSSRLQGGAKQRRATGQASRDRPQAHQRVPESHFHVQPKNRYDQGTNQSRRSFFCQFAPN